MVANASSVEAFRDFGDKFFYFKKQIVWAILGILVFLFSLNFNYKHYKIMVMPLLIFCLVSLVAVMIPGLGIKALGAKRWLGYGNLRFQPAELTKLAFILWSAAYFTNQRRKFPFLVIMGILVGLIMLEPDLGTTVVIVISGLGIYFASGASIWQMFLLGLIGLGGGLGLIFSSAYRKQRLLTFLNPAKDPLGASYHIRQILLALGSGGITGLGLGQSRQKYEYLPEVTTDSIFAVIAEETGFTGSCILVLLFLLFIWQGIKIAKQAPDQFSRLLALGITVWIGIQVLVNLAAMTALIPLTGIPLPFVSYGGSSLVLTLFACGILANISKYKVVKK
jgi:cell division protein FtsW